MIDASGIIFFIYFSTLETIYFSNSETYWVGGVSDCFLRNLSILEAFIIAISSFYGLTVLSVLPNDQLDSFLLTFSYVPFLCLLLLSIFKKFIAFSLSLLFKDPLPRLETIFVIYVISCSCFCFLSSSIVNKLVPVGPILPICKHYWET